MATQLKLLSTDFDGTLIDPSLSPATFTPLWTCIRHLQKEHGLLWAINTGRDLSFTLQGLADWKIPVKPDFLLTMEREIHLPGETDNWVPHLAWNDQCLRDHRDLELRIGHHLRAFQRFLHQSTSALAVIEEGRFVGIEASSEEELAGIVLRMDDFFGECPELSYQRNGIYLRFSHHRYHKGAVLHELSQMLGIGPDEVAAAGDNFNDLSMLTGEFAGITICPSNAVPEVIEQVRQSGGMVTQNPAGLGVLEALQSLYPEA